MSAPALSYTSHEARFVGLYTGKLYAAEPHRPIDRNTALARQLQVFKKATTAMVPVLTTPLRPCVYLLVTCSYNVGQKSLARAQLH